MKPEQKMDKQKAQQMFELANRLMNLDANTLSEQQLQQRNDMIFKLKEEIKMLDEASLAQMRNYFKATDPKVRSISPTAKYVANTDPNAQANMQKRFRSQAEYEEWLEKNGLKQISGVKKEGMAEEFNGEYDDEAGMVQSNLRTMARAVNGLLDTIEDNDNLPEWAQEKLAKAEMMTTSVWDYLLSQKEQGIDPKVTESSQRVDSLVTDALRIMKGAEVSDAVSALKTVLGDREYNGRRGHYNFYVRQILDMYSQQGVAKGLKEFAPGNGGGESGRWYTDDQMTDIVGDGWYNDLDVSGDIPKQQMIQEAQAWLDDQGYSVHVLNCKVNDDDMEWFIEGSFQNSRFAKKGVAEAKKPSPKLTTVNIKKTDPVSEEINTEAYERLQKVFAFKNYES